MTRQTHRLTNVWLLLVAATLLAWFLGRHAGSVATRVAPAVAASILVVAFAKIALVFAYFMELRWAPYRLGAIAVTWVAVECGVLIWMFAG